LLPRGAGVAFILAGESSTRIRHARAGPPPPVEQPEKGGDVTAIDGDPTEAGSGFELGSTIVRVLGFAVGWWLVTEGRGGLVSGALAVAAATFASTRLAAPERVRVSLRGAARFVPFFLEHSVRGGVDVAWRAFHPSLPLGASMHEMELQLQAPAARSLFAAVVSLLPGTLSVDLEGRHVRLHVLAGGEAALDRLRELEAIVGAMIRPTRGGPLL
jgi:multicomponent Na+:H+ antiporter subunit E